jgi:uncharacterized membrane protein
MSITVNMNYILFFTIFSILATVTSICFLVLLITHKDSFIYFFIVYILATSIYGFVYHTMQKKHLDLSKDSALVNYYATSYISLFNMIISVAIICVLVITKILKGKQGYSY